MIKNRDSLKIPITNLFVKVLQIINYSTNFNIYTSTNSFNFTLFYD